MSLIDKKRTISAPSLDQIVKKVGDEKAKYLLGYKPNELSKRLPFTAQSGDMIEKVYQHSGRNNRVLHNLAWMYNNGNLANTGYLSILPVDQGIEHDFIASFEPNPIYMKPENIVKLAIEAGCNAVASTFGVLDLVSRKYAHKIPFIVKINHNELLTMPQTPEQILFGSVKHAYDMGAAAVGATIYFGSKDSRREIIEIAQAFELAHELGMATVLWCYLRNDALKTSEKDFHVSADGTGVADHLGVTIGADIIKQKLPENDGAIAALGGKFAKGTKKYDEAMKNAHPVDLARVQIAGAYGGQIPTINSGGASTGKGFDADVAQAIETAIINKMAGGAGLISGRKAFQKSMEQGIELMHWIQAVYLSKDIQAPFKE